MHERIAVSGLELAIPAVFVRRRDREFTDVDGGGATIGAFRRPRGAVCRGSSKIRARDARPSPYACACAQPGLLCQTHP